MVWGVEGDWARDGGGVGYSGVIKESTREQALNHRETSKLAPINLNYNCKALVQAPGQARALDEKNCLHLKAGV